MTIQIFIPTYGRVGEQYTIKNFPEEMYGCQVNLVAPKHEDHGDLPVIPIPDESEGSISKKRQWIMEYCKSNNISKMMMVDDDTFFRTRDSDKKTRVMDIDDLTLLLDRIEELLDTYTIVGGTSQFMNNQKPDESVNFEKGGPEGMFCINVEKFFEYNVCYEKNPVFEDVGVMFDTFINGGDIIALGNFICSDKSSDIGGNFSTPDFNKKYIENLKLFQQNYPKYVTLKYKEGGKVNQRVCDYTIRFQWKKLKESRGLPISMDLL